MPKNTDTINLTPSVRNALSKIRSETTSWRLIQELLKFHGEYGNRRAAQIAESKGPANLQKKPKERWISDVLELFDPDLVKELHGRLLILGLCQLDEYLKDFLDRIGFLLPISEELQEDFDSLLLPSYAGEQAYRRTFLKRLNNKPEHGTKLRNRGFIALVKGGPGLKEMATLCHRQRWNTCFTVRYVMDQTSAVFEPAELLADDLFDSKGSELGDFTPAVDSWKEIKQWINPNAEKFGIIGMERSRSRDFMQTGQRLILLIEYRRMPNNLSPEAIQLDELLSVMEYIPERVCLVISGLPDSISSMLEKYPSESDANAPVLVLDIPKDLELTRSEPLSNDIPSGPDQLNLMNEVNALAEAMVLKDLKPPLVVGILGGWGSGKSFVLHLIKNRIQEIRCEPVNGPEDQGFPFVGHPYIIKFDAWTYAKSNLWASLMQKIFMDLDRQIGLEQMLTKKLGKDLKQGQSTQIWRVLNDLTEEERERITKTELGKKAVEIVDQLKSGDIQETNLWDVLEDLKTKEIRKLNTAEKQMEESRIKRDEAAFELKNAIRKRIEIAAKQEAIEEIGDQLLESAWQSWTGKNRDKQVPTFTQLKSSVSWWKVLKSESTTYLVALVIFALIGALITFLSDYQQDLKIGFSGLAGILGSLATGYFRFQQWAQKTREQFNEASNKNLRDLNKVYESVVELAGKMKKGETVGDDNKDSFVNALLKDPAAMRECRTLVAQDKDYQKYKSQVATIRQRVGMAARHRNLLDFVQNRLEGRIYEDKLGLLHQVKDDLEELSDALMHDNREQPLFTRGKPRIILLIDDLDRCPPPKVVEVLEAAQLLVKTSLFVVVIAMDVRYVTRALEHQYEGVLTPLGEPTGLDYIEKIIQIPYRVRPASESSVKQFLWDQMKPHKPEEESNSDKKSVQGQSAKLNTKTKKDKELQEGEESRTPDTRSGKTELRILPTETLHFSEQEYKTITTCCSEFDVSPRTMKRLVNVFKLLKIIWYRDKLGNGPAEDIKRTMLAMLVIAAKYPEPMRELLHLLERQYVSVEKIADKSVVEFLKEVCDNKTEKAVVPQMWYEVKEAISNDKLVAQELTFAEFHEQHLHLVSSFSFVGESDPFRQSELEKREVEAEVENHIIEESEDS